MSGKAQNYYSDSIWRYAPKSIYDETNHTLGAFTGREMIYENTGGKHGRYLPDVFLSAMDNFVRVNQPDFANHFRPFFLLVNLPAPRTATDGQADFPVPTDAPFTGEKWPQAAKNRAAMITRLDDGIGPAARTVEKTWHDQQRRHLFHQRDRPGKICGHQSDDFSESSAAKCAAKIPKPGCACR